MASFEELSLNKAIKKDAQMFNDLQTYRDNINCAMSYNTVFNCLFCVKVTSCSALSFETIIG